MKAVGIKVLKNKLSEYVRLAAQGETVLVTDRDEVVAELGPPRPGRAETLSDVHLAEAVRNGWIAPPTEAPDRPRPGLVEPVWRTLAEMIRELDESREDRA